MNEVVLRDERLLGAMIPEMILMSSKAVAHHCLRLWRADSLVNLT